jgi:hypothetical protein
LIINIINIIIVVFIMENWSESEQRVLSLIEVHERQTKIEYYLCCFKRIRSVRVKMADTETN